ncbi:MAG: serine/threonine protein kinase [Tannerella sp.]|jgi:serine/threonine-protein kinase|nr:serine/threonine protein kinase [Tannerella sp.]
MNLPKGYYLQDKKYHLSNVIGQGGFGITYMGTWSTDVKGELGTVRTDVPVCIKEYFFKDYCFRDKKTFHVQVHSKTGQVLFDKFKEKLIKEAKILSEVHHPFVVNVLEVFEENNTAYIAMEHIQGCSLKYMLDTNGILEEKKVLKYIYQIGQALDFVHQKNILHLDIKPSNILIDKRNNARLIDFGVSKRYDIEQQETSTTMLTLSKGFASIEQYDSEGIQSFSPCPDIYSLGATMYNLLTGVIPTESILRATKPLAKPIELNKEITSKTADVILKAMKVNPAERYQNVRAMINELDIPSYFEETENTLIESLPSSSQSHAADNEEETVHAGARSPQQIAADDEQTKFRDPEVSRAIRKKKRKRRVVIPLLIFVFTFVGYAVAYIWVAESPQGTVELNESRGAARNNNSEEPKSDEAASGETVETAESAKMDAKKLTAQEEKAKKEAEAKLLAEKNNTSEPIHSEPSAEEINASYKSLIVSGKTKMEQKKYAEAKKDFQKANELKATDEAFQLFLSCAEKEEEQQIIERKALYEMKMPFGNYTIVRKILTGRYGAIDSKGKERIEAKYLRVAPCSDGRAFEREDHMYDIYNTNGDLIGAGYSTYQ